MGAGPKHCLLGPAKGSALSPITSSVALLRAQLLPAPSRIVR